jgi:RNA polymerase sigma factor, sigma-70 family
MNELSFEKMVAAYSRLVYTVCYRLINDYQEAENITQETFIIAYKMADKFVGDNYKAWLVKIASNKCKDYLKSAYMKKIQPVDLDDLSGIPSGDNPAEAIVAMEEAENVREACNSLEEPYKTVAALYFLDEKPFDEVAAILNRPVKTVQTQVYRSKIKLKEILEEGRHYD